MKSAKKITLLFIVAILSLLMTVPASAEEANLKITLRIEGAEKTLFYDTIEIPDKNGLTVLDVVRHADENCDELDVTAEDGYYGEYISGINGEDEAQIMYDGWLFTVNGFSASVGVSGYEVKDGDSVVLYYCDSFGTEPFQIPILDASKIDSGVLKFTSKDVTYDASYNPTQSINPVVGATVTWGYDGKTVEYTTDKNGEVKIDSDKLTVGEHSVQIEKYSDTVTAGGKLPLVLRLPADTVVVVEETVEDDTTIKEEEKLDTDTEQSPETGEDSLIYALVALIGVSTVSVISGKKLLQNNVK